MMMMIMMMVVKRRCCGLRTCTNQSLTFHARRAQARPFRGTNRAVYALNPRLSRAKIGQTLTTTMKNTARYRDKRTAQIGASRAHIPHSGPGIPGPEMTAGVPRIWREIYRLR
jgi:hypothetical protein